MRADVIFVRVRQHDGAHHSLVLLQVGDVRDDDVHAEQFLLGEHQARVDHDDVVAGAQRHHVHAEFAQSAQRNGPQRWFAQFMLPAFSLSSSKGVTQLQQSAQWRSAHECVTQCLGAQCPRNRIIFADQRQVRREESEGHRGIRAAHFSGHRLAATKSRSEGPVTLQLRKMYRMLLSSAAGKKARDGHQQHGAHRRRSQAAQKSERGDSQARKNPAADHRADES